MTDNPISNMVHLKEWNADNLKELRKRCELTQPEVANFIGVTPNTIGAIEQGKTTTFSILQFYGIVLSMYANAIGVQTDDFDTPIIIKHQYEGNNNGRVIKWT